MGEYREIVSTYRRPLPESWRDSRVPEEVVEVYRRSFPAETVERYSRPLPRSHPEAGRQKPLEMRTVLIPLRQDGQTEADPAETRPDMAVQNSQKGRKGRKGRKKAPASGAHAAPDAETPASRAGGAPSRSEPWGGSGR